MSFPTAFPPALDSAFPPAVGEEGAGAISFDLAAGIYSIRRVRAAYTGPCMRVRRSSDNAEIDVFWAGGLVDSAAIMAHVGAGDGFVTTWYDQSGKANHATQTTAGNQPSIVASGVMQMLLGRPTVQFSASPHAFMYVPPVLFTDVPYGIACATSRRSATTGVQSRLVAFAAAAGGSMTRFLFGYNLGGSGSGTSIGGRRLDTDTFISASEGSARNNIDTTMTGGLLWTEGRMIVYRRENISFTNTLLSSGNSDSIVSNQGTIGSESSSNSHIGPISEVILFTSLVDLARLQHVTSAFWGT